MTVQEYIDHNLPFYHITPESNVTDILENGLEARRCNAICVVQSHNPEMWKEIINGQLAYQDSDFAVIKLEPQKHNIRVCEVAPDSSEEYGTGPLQNYIDKPVIRIDENDFAERHFQRGIRPHFDIFRHLVRSLEDYKH